jgi:hypothetical protein
MDDKTEELRDIFRAVTDAEEVTESQDADRGSLAPDERDTEAAIADVVARMREELDFDTDLDAATYVAIVRGYFAGEDDATIAADAGVDAGTAFQARLDLHLVRDEEAPPVDPGRLRRDFGGVDADTVADELGVSVADVARARAVLAARSATRRASDRYRAAFLDALPDAAIAATITESVREDGLREATEDIDSLESDADVDF